MSSSDRKQPTAVYAYTAVAAFCIFFNYVYSFYGHGVSSYFMTYMFLFPLLGGSLVFGGFYRLGNRGKAPSRLSFNFYNTGIAWLTVGSCLKGVMEISGYGSHYIKYFFVIGVLFLLFAVLAYITQCFGKKPVKIKYLCLILLGTSQLLGQVPFFEDRIDLGVISYQPNALTDISGMAASIKNKNVIWLHNDNDDGTAYAINLQGKQLAAFKLASVQCKDIEDIAIGPGPEEDRNYIYLGDFGDNYSRRSIKYIYRFIEPEVGENQSYVEADISDIDIFKFTYPGDERDAETLILDPLSSEIYIASKERQITNIYKLNIPESSEEVAELEFITEVDISEASGGNISPSGKEIVITNGKKVYYWKRVGNEKLSATFKQLPATIKYVQEPKGEAISWDSDETGYFTTSEARGVQPHLYYYPMIPH